MAYVSYVYRLYPNNKQKTYFAKAFGCMRFVYNHYLSETIKKYEEDKSHLSYLDCCKDLTQLKKTDECNFLSEIDTASLQQSLRHLDVAFSNFFRRPNIGYPKFKAKNKCRKAYTTYSPSIRIENQHIRLPKVGFVKVVQHRPIPEGHKIKSATVSQSPSGKYFVSLLLEYESKAQPIKPRKFVGLHYSMQGLYKDSKGKEPKFPGFYTKAEEKLKREQRKLSRMQQGSKNWEKQRIVVAKVHEKIANQRKDFLHKRAKYLARKYDCVCIEDVNIKEMVQECDSDTAKEILDESWAKFTTFLNYKLADHGKQLIKLDKDFDSTQICNVCGYKNTSTHNLAIRAWDCPNCGAHHERDINAAINIMNEGKRLVALQTAASSKVDEKANQSK